MHKYEHMNYMKIAEDNSDDNMQPLERTIEHNLMNKLNATKDNPINVKILDKGNYMKSPLAMNQDKRKRSVQDN